MGRVALRTLSPAKIAGLVLCFLGLSAMVVLRPLRAHVFSSDKVLVIDDGNIAETEEKVKSGAMDLFLLFYSDRFCKDAFPAVNNLAEVLHKAENVNLKVGAVNAIESGEASARYSIKHFPTFHLVSSKGVGNMGHEEYQGARTVGAFLQYLKGKYPIFVDEKGDFVPPRLYSDDHDVLISKIVASDDAKSLNSLIKEIAKARDDPSAIKKGYESYDMLHKLAVKISANPEAEIALETLKDLHEKLQGIINMESGDSVQVNLEGIKHRVHTKFIIGKLISSYQKKLSEGDATATKGSVLEDLGSEDI